jgi:predicted kinase
MPVSARVASAQNRRMRKPTLVVVTGPAGSGKTTIAHELARAIGCPAICRDEIKEGMVHAHGPFEAAWGDELTRRTFPLFFDVVGSLVRGGVTVVAEAAFQHFNWEPNLAPFADAADIRVVRCRTDPVTARSRVEVRGRRTAHADGALLAGLDAGDLYYENFEHISIDAPTLDVDTTSGYDPTLDEIVAFIERG